MPLFLPSHRYEVEKSSLKKRMDWSYPSLSKSAPCKCCKQGQDANCSQCTPHFPATATLTDAYYGACTLTLSAGKYTGLITNGTIPPGKTFLITNCSTFTTTTANAFGLNYTVSCQIGSPDFLQLKVTVWACKAVTCNSPGTAVCAYNAVGSTICGPLTFPSVSFPANCSTPSFTFTMPALVCAADQVGCQVYPNPTNIVISA